MMNQKIVIVLGVLLVTVVVVQSAFLFRMSGKVDQLSQQSGAVEHQASPPAGKAQPSLINPRMFSQDDDWNPFEEMQRMQNEMNKIFGNVRSQFQLSPDFSKLTEPFSFSPNVDVKEESDRFIVTADIPGSDESNINVKVENQQLTISASTKKSHDNNKKGNLFRSERFVGQFQRSIMLPEPVLAEKMKTDYRDGVLTITIPKA
jgi:HSP20 family protein